MDKFDDLFLSPLEELERKFILSEERMIEILEERKIKALESFRISTEQYYQYKEKN